MGLHCVITGDLINSSELEGEERERILKILKEEFRKLKKSKKVKFTIFRGDSFQGVTQKPEEGLDIALIIKSLLNKLEKKESDTKLAKGSKPIYNTRMALGIGSVDFQRETPEESDGEAFRNSGHSLDEMKRKGQQVIIKSPWADINEEFETECKLLDAITEKWLTASAEVVYFLLLGHKEQEIANILQISQSAVNQRKRNANWDAIEHMLNRYRNIITNQNK